MSTYDKDNDQDTGLPLDDAEHHNDQQNRRGELKVDDDPNMSADAAPPDFLVAPKRGKGVRRLNRFLLVIVGGVVALAVMGATYTMYDRQQQQRAVASGTGEAHTVGVVAELLVQLGPASVLPAPPEMLTDTGQSDVGQQV